MGAAGPCSSSSALASMGALQPRHCHFPLYHPTPPHPMTSPRRQVVDSNPYSRLMALQRMGIVQDYEKIRDKTVRGRGRGHWGGQRLAA